MDKEISHRLYWQLEVENDSAQTSLAEKITA